MSGTEAMIRIDVEGELEKIIQQLNRLPDQIAAPNILKNAVNATARKVRACLINGRMTSGERFFRWTRQKIAGILGVFQDLFT